MLAEGEAEDKGGVGVRAVEAAVGGVLALPEGPGVFNVVLGSRTENPQR